MLVCCSVLVDPAEVSCGVGVSVSSSVSLCWLFAGPLFCCWSGAPFGMPVLFCPSIDGGVPMLLFSVPLFSVLLFPVLPFSVLLSMLLFIMGMSLFGEKLVDGRLDDVFVVVVVAVLMPSLTVNAAAQPSATMAIIIIILAVSRFVLFIL